MRYSTSRQSRRGLTDRKDIIKPIGFHRESTALTDTDMKYLLLYLEDKYALTSEKKIQKAISIVADCNKYHPCLLYTSSKEKRRARRLGAMGCACLELVVAL